MKNLIFLTQTCKKINYSRILTILVLCIFTLMACFIMDTSVCLAAKSKSQTENKSLLKQKTSLKDQKSLKHKAPLNRKKILKPIKKSKDEKKPEDKKQMPIHITSDTMVSERTAGFVEFSGNARADDGDSIIKADSIKIFSYTPQEQKKRKKEKKQGSIKKIIASGNVRYSSGNKKAFADRAVYTTDSEVIVLTGKAPYVTMGSSFVKGKKITLFKKDSKIIVESGKKRRVEAFFNSKDKIKK